MLHSQVLDYHSKIPAPSPAVFVAAIQVCIYEWTHMYIYYLYLIHQLCDLLLFFSSV
jgi:hypothetical protein